MNFFLRRINNKMTLSSAAVVIAVSLGLGMILGLIKTQLINANFHSGLTGAYFSAFKLPELILYTFGAGSLSVAFIPVLIDQLAGKNRKQAWQLTAYVLNIIALVMFFVCLILVIFPRPILEHVIARGFDADRLDIAAQIMRLAATGPLIFSIASILGSVQQVMGRFLFYAIAPIFYHLSMIASIYLFKDSMGIICLGLGAAFGGILNLLIVASGMNKLNYKHIFRFNFKFKPLKQVFQVLPFRSLDQGIVYMNSIVQISLASALSVGSVANLENAFILYNAPITLLGLALGIAVFPQMANKLAQKQPELFKKEFLKVLGAAIWIIVPVIIICFIYRNALAQIIFTRANSQLAGLFGWLCIGILFRTMYAIVSRFYYAQKDTLTPMLVTVVVFVSNWFLSWWLSQELGLIGFGIATSIVTVLEILILLTVIRFRHKGIFNRRFGFKLVKIMSVGCLTLLTTLFIQQIWEIVAVDHLILIMVKLAFASSLILLFYCILSYIFRIKEIFLLLRYLKHIVSKLSTVFYERRA